MVHVPVQALEETLGNTQSERSVFSIATDRFHVKILIIYIKIYKKHVKPVLFELAAKVGNVSTNFDLGKSTETQAKKQNNP